MILMRRNYCPASGAHSCPASGAHSPGPAGSGRGRRTLVADDKFWELGTCKTISVPLSTQMLELCCDPEHLDHCSANKSEKVLSVALWMMSSSDSAEQGQANLMSPRTVQVLCTNDAQVTILTSAIGKD